MKSGTDITWHQISQHASHFRAVFFPGLPLMPNKSEGAKSASSRANEGRNDIESIFPVNQAPWNHPEDPQLRSQYIKPPLFRFDFGMTLVPWRIRILWGLHSYGLHSARRLSWDDIGFDKLNRKSVWRKFGQTLHFLTLEFGDVSLEKGYQLDYAERSHTYVQVSGVFVAIICALAVGKLLQDHGDELTCSTGKTLMTCTLFYAMIFGLLRSVVSLSFVRAKGFRRWLVPNFQIFQTAWASVALLTCLTFFYFNPYPECTVSGQEAGTYTVLVVISAVFFRLRFIYLLGLVSLSIVYMLIVRWFSPVAGMSGWVDPVMMLVATLGSLGTVYLVEVMLRKDFVQSLAVTTESQRSDRLLRNVLPKRIIDTLKRRQDGTLANASVGGTIGPGATALFTRTVGTAALPAASRFAPTGNASWVRRPGQTGQFDNQISRFDSRVGTQLANTALAEAFDSVTILFADVVGFTKISSRVTPEQLVLLLNELFTVFDNLADANGLEKIKTIGDAFMAAAGLPNPHPLHAHAAARMALQMTEAVSMFCDDLGNPLLIRIGLHSGSCVAGVIGRRKFIYDVWGDCVNTASRMESHGEPMRVHCSQETADKIQHDFELEYRGEMEIKGKGKMKTYFIVAEKPHSKFRSVLPCDINQWRDRFNSLRGSIDTESLKRVGSQRSLDPITDEEDGELAEDEIF